MKLFRVPGMEKKLPWKPCWREISGKRFYARSLWEANYAFYLEFLKRQNLILDWEHEPKTFWFEAIRRGVRSYLPDFAVLSMGNEIEYHEVKGYMDCKSNTKLKRMAKYYPETKVILIRKKEYNEIKNKLAPMIFGWDWS